MSSLRISTLRFIFPMPFDPLSASDGLHFRGSGYVYTHKYTYMYLYIYIYIYSYFHRPSFGALLGRLKFTVTGHEFNKDALFSWCCARGASPRIRSNRPPVTRSELYRGPRKGCPADRSLKLQGVTCVQQLYFPFLKKKHAFSRIEVEPYVVPFTRQNPAFVSYVPHYPINGVTSMTGFPGRQSVALIVAYRLYLLYRQVF